MTKQKGDVLKCFFCNPWRSKHWRFALPQLDLQPKKSFDSQKGLGKARFELHNFSMQKEDAKVWLQVLKVDSKITWSFKLYLSCTVLCTECGCSCTSTETCWRAQTSLNGHMLWCGFGDGHQEWCPTAGILSALRKKITNLDFPENLWNSLCKLPVFFLNVGFIQHL